MAKITGIGGVFIKSPDRQRIIDWYSEKLGLKFEDYGGLSFEWINESDPETPGNTVFSFFKEDSDYFAPSEKPVMINFRVDNLLEYLNELAQKGVEQVGGVQDYVYGKFAWIMDIDGNKLELWEPVDKKLEP